jgi:uroporphyrinogen decarboxylase
MSGRDRVLKALHFEEPDRVPSHDSPWWTTVERWRREGLPADMGPQEYFGYEFAGAGADDSLRLPYELIEETDQYRIERNANGAVARNWKVRTSTPEMLDFTIKTPEDWEEHKPRLAFAPDRVDVEGIRRAGDAAREKGYWFHFVCAAGYDRTQGMVGTERLLMAMAEEPDWVADMFLTSARVAVANLRYALDQGLQFDGVFAYNDMGYRNASLFSPAMYRRLQKPADELVYGFCHEVGLKVILHSCGNVSALVPDLIDAGLDCLQPLEVKSGMNLVELKRLYGDRLAFMGGIDVRAMAAEDPALIEEEIATKLPVAMEGGGYIYHSDHSVPDNISFDRYCYVMELVRRYGTYRA